jgi:peptidylprolyl isomerase
MKSTSTLPLLVLAASACALSAQTTHPATHTTATHAVSHMATAAHTGGACLSFPEVSAKVPALAAGLSCPKALYTVTRHSELSLDYKSPIVVGDHLDDAFGTKAITITLGYVDTKIGTGELAKPDMYYTVNYTGYLPDGTKFDSSYDHKPAEPITFPYGKHQVVAGWDTGFEGMHVGGTRRLFVPYQLAYGEQGKPPTIPAKSMLVFDLELVSQSATAPAPKTPPAPAKTAPIVPPAASGKPAPAKPETK